MDHVAFEELLGRMQEDLPVCQERLHPHEVDGVLELIAKAEGPARLVEAAAGINSLGQRLVLQPLEIGVERRLGGSAPALCRSGPATNGGFLETRPDYFGGCSYLRTTASARVLVVGLA